MNVVDITRTQYNNMLGRVRKQHKGRDRSYVHLSFSLAEYRGWVYGLLGSEGQGVTRCGYCMVPLGIATMIPDHRLPLSRGGDWLGVENLTPACEACNDAKGALTDREFIDLREALYHIGTYALQNVLSRLAKAEKLAAVHRRVMSLQRPTAEKMI